MSDDEGDYAPIDENEEEEPMAVEDDEALAVSPCGSPAAEGEEDEDEAEEPAPDDGVAGGEGGDEAEGDGEEEGDNGGAPAEVTAEDEEEDAEPEAEDSMEYNKRRWWVPKTAIVRDHNRPIIAKDGTRLSEYRRIGTKEKWGPVEPVSVVVVKGKIKVDNDPRPLARYFWYSRIAVNPTKCTPEQYASDCKTLVPLPKPVVSAMVKAMQEDDNLANSTLITKYGAHDSNNKTLDPEYNGWARNDTACLSAEVRAPSKRKGGAEEAGGEAPVSSAAASKRARQAEAAAEPQPVKPTSNKHGKRPASNGKAPAAKERVEKPAPTPPPAAVAPSPPDSEVEDAAPAPAPAAKTSKAAGKAPGKAAPAAAAPAGANSKGTSKTAGVAACFQRAASAPSAPAPSPSAAPAAAPAAPAPAAAPAAAAAEAGAGASADPDVRKISYVPVANASKTVVHAVPGQNLIAIIEYN
jgi:hypothetical protein